MIPRLHSIARRSNAAQQSINQHTRAAPLVPVDHHARRIVNYPRDGVMPRFAFESCVSVAKDDALQAAVSSDKLKLRSKERLIVFVRLRIEQVDASDIAFAALGGLQSAVLPTAMNFDRTPCRSNSPRSNPAQRSDCRSRPDRRAEARGPIAGPENRPCLNNLFVPADRGEAIGAAEGGNTAGSLSHRIRDKRRSPVHKSDEDILRPANLAIHFTANLADTVMSFLRTAPRQQANHRRDELVKGEDRRSRKAWQYDNSTPAGRGETDGLAGFERHAVSDNSRIVEFGDNAIRHVSSPLLVPPERSTMSANSSA